MRKIHVSILIIVIILVVGVLYISYITTQNETQLNKIVQNIQENYNIKEEINYSNQYGNYYIITTKNQVIVLNKEYQEILKEDISSLAENKENLSLIYKTNKLMYEKTTRKENEITYKYYDATTGELIKTTSLERQ